MMTGRERLIAALRRREVDRIPWSLCMDGYYTNSLPEQGFHMNLMETLRYFRNDIMERHVPMFRLVHDGVDERRMERDGEWVRILSTPVGEIREHHLWTAGTWFIKKPLLCSIEDVKIYHWIVERSRYEADYQPFLKQDAFIGEDGLATPSGPLTPIQEMFQRLMHIENTVYLLQDEPDEMESLFESIHRLNKQAYRIIAESTAEVVFTYEDTSTTVMSRDMYQRYSAPQIDEYADIIHGGGKVYITHMCGKLKGFAKEVGMGRMDGVDSLCPPTTGDFWAHEARRCWPEKIIIGGLEPPYLQRASEEETIRYTVDVLNRMAPGKDFILSSGDAVSYGTPVCNLARITDLIERYGKMPMDGKIDPDEAVKEFLGRPYP